MSGGSLEKLTRAVTYWRYICFLRFRGVPGFLGGDPGFLRGVLGFLGVFRAFWGVFLVFLGCSGFSWECSGFLGGVPGFSGMFRDVPVFRVPVFLEVLHYTCTPKRWPSVLPGMTRIK